MASLFFIWKDITILNPIVSDNEANLSGKLDTISENTKVFCVITRLELVNKLVPSCRTDCNLNVYRLFHL